MKIFSLALIMPFLSGCDSYQDRIIDSRTTVKIEGCEYFVFNGSRELGIVHKGNCHNPIHYHNPESQ